MTSWAPELGREQSSMTYWDPELGREELSMTSWVPDLGREQLSMTSWDPDLGREQLSMTSRVNCAACCDVPVSNVSRTGYHLDATSGGSGRYLRR